MTLLAPALQAFFTERLITQRNSSPQTIAAYRDTFRLLLTFAQRQTGKAPFQLDIDDLDAPLIGAFLTHLEKERGNSPRTRNARLGAIHSFYRFAALGHPEHAHTIARVMAIPTKRHERNTVSYLDLTEIKALLSAPDPTTWLGRRDHALLLLMIQTGVRVSELVGLRVGDIHLGIGPHIKVTGKGRKKRATPLTKETVAIQRRWLTERRGDPDDPLFPTRPGRPLSRYTVGLLVTKHAATASVTCPSLTSKRVTEHPSVAWPVGVVRVEVPVNDPVPRLVRVGALGPLVGELPQVGVQCGECRAGHADPEVGRPAPDDRGELGDHRVGVGPTKGQHLGGEPFPDPLHGRFAGLDQQFLVAIPADVEAQELETFFEVDNLRLVLVEGQAPGRQPVGQPLFDLFGLFTAVAHRYQVICISHQDGAAPHHAAGIDTGRVIANPSGLLHTVQGHVHHQGTDHAALRRALLGRGEPTSLDHTRLQPSPDQFPAGDGAERGE
jgi:site-specific recombinase XerD